MINNIIRLSNMKINRNHVININTNRNIFPMINLNNNTNTKKLNYLFSTSSNQ